MGRGGCTGIVIATVLCVIGLVAAAVIVLTQEQTKRHVADAEVRRLEIVITATAAADQRHERTMYAIKDAYIEGRASGKSDGTELMFVLAAALITATSVLLGLNYAVNRRNF